MAGRLHQCMMHGLQGKALDELAWERISNSFPKLALQNLRQCA
jgi:hypothetical protein